MAQPQWDMDVDVLVFGSGVAGLAAGIFAAKQGKSVLVCEKSGLIGGTSATSGGAIYIPNSRQAKAAGITDSADAARAYYRAELGDLYEDRIIDAFIESGPEALAELERDTGVGFDLLPWPDYHPAQPGAALVGRSLGTHHFDGRKLGKDFERLRPPLKSLMILGGMSIGQEEVGQFLRPFTSRENLRYVLARLRRHLSDRLRYSRGTDLRHGNALVASLLHALTGLGGVVSTNARLVELIVEDGKAVGASVMRDDQPLRIRAAAGVILATGGLARNSAKLAQLFPDFPHRHSMAFEGNTGDGIDAACAVGGVLHKHLPSPLLWTPASRERKSDGSEVTVMYGYLDRGRPGVIAVDAAGKRFVNESNSYHDIVAAMYDHGYAAGNRFWFVCDRDFVRKHGLGKIRPKALSIRRYIKQGYLASGRSLQELAAAIQVDAAGLAQTVKRHNFYAKTGVDPEFGRGGNVYNRQFGDPAAGINPNLAPILQPPFLALEIVPASLGSTVGLDTDEHARVLDAQGQPIAGLYACGNDMVSIARGRYPGGGVTLGPAIAFAYRAVSHIKASVI